jgi:hypothetical protein
MPALLDRITSAFATRYPIERELGQGGMATVYLARDPKHGRLVAVKVFRPELATSVGAERFLREIQVAARLAAFIPGSQPTADASIAVLPFVNLSADPENEYFTHAAQTGGRTQRVAAAEAEQRKEPTCGGDSKPDVGSAQDRHDTALLSRGSFMT